MRFWYTHHANKPSFNMFAEKIPVLQYLINALVLDFEVLKRLPVVNENVPYGLFTLPDSNTDSHSDCKPNGYIVLFHCMELDADSNPNCQPQEWDWNRNQNPDL